MSAQEMVELHSGLGTARCEFYLYNLDRGIGPKTVKRYDRVLEQFEAFIRKIPGSEINLMNFTASEVRAWIGSSEDEPGYLSVQQGKSPSAVFFCEKVIVQYTKFASSIQLIEYDLMVGEIRYKLEEGSLPVVAECDVWSMLEQALGYVKGKVCVHLLFFEGLCPLEIINLRVSDLVDTRDQLKATITIRPRGAGNWKARLTTISSCAQDLIRQYLSQTKRDRGKSIWIFPGRNPETHVKRSALYYWIKKLAEAAGVSGATAKKIRNAGLVYGKFGEDPHSASKAFRTVTDRFNSPHTSEIENRVVRSKKEVYKPKDQARLDRFIVRFRKSNEEGLPGG